MIDKPTPAASREVARSTGIAWATLLLAGSNIASRALGLLRDTAISGLAGASAETDAYFAAFRIPDLLNSLLIGGALVGAFLPLYTGWQAREGAAAAERLFHTVLGTLLAGALLVTLLAWWFADGIVALLFSGFPPRTLALTAEITRIVLPAQIFFAAGGVINATLLARGRFAALALQPLVYNLCIVVVGAALYPRLGIHSFAWGVLAGGALGPFLMPFLDALPRVPLRLRIAPLDPGFRAYLWMAVPFMLGFSLLTVDEWYHSIFGARLAAGSVSQLAYARRVMLVPVGAIGQAIGTAALPALSQLWAERRTQELNDTLQQTLCAGLFLAVVIAVGTALFAGPLVMLAFARGRFTAADASIVAALLAILAVSVPAWIGQQIAVRGFYARGDTWRPMLLGTLLVAASFPLYLGLAQSAGVRGLALAAVLSMSANAGLTCWLARRLHGGPLLGPLAASLLRALAVSLGSAALVGGAIGALAGADALWSPPQRALENLALLVCGGSLYVVLAGLGTARFGDPAIRGLLRRLAARIARRR